MSTRLYGVAALVALAVLAGPAAADLIVFTDGLAMEGKVTEVTNDHVVVTVFHGEWGEIVIPRRRVSKIEYDIKSRLEGVPKDDYLGRYKLGKWAAERGLMNEALEILEPLVGKPGVPDQIHAILLRIYESQDDLKKALDQAVALLKSRPKDVGLLGKIKEFRKELDLKPGEGAGANVLKTPGKAPKAPTPNGGNRKPAPAQPKPTQVGGEGLEALRWKRENWGNPCEVQTHDEKGNKMLWIGVAENAGKDKTCVSLGKRMSFKGKSKLRMSVLNSNSKRTYNFAIAVSTKAGYHESMMKRIRGGWNMNVEFDLSSAKWKSSKTKWQFRTKIISPGEVRQIFLLIYNGSRDVSMFIDDIRVE